MKWKTVRPGRWAFGPLRIEREGEAFLVWQAQLELPLGQKPLKPARFSTLKAAKEWGKTQATG